ncbi:hypothetical protein D3C76_928440 [compost metagenome]
MRKISFIIANDTIFYSLDKVIRNLIPSCHVDIWTQHGVNEGAENIIQSKYPAFYKGKLSIFRAFYIKSEAVVLCNDWSSEAKSIIKILRSRGIPTVCLQESVVGFKDKFKRLEHSDYVLTQDVSSGNLISSPKIIPVGNPRYEEYETTKVAAHGRQVLINCNFTYGIFEDVRQSWLRDCVSTVLKAGYIPKISKHPRDHGNLDEFAEYVIPSSVSSIAAQIEASKLIITRFSSLIHESILKGRPVIYYNPHGENFNYEFGQNFEALRYANNKESLEDAFMSLSQKHIDVIHQDSVKYINENLIIKEKKPSEQISDFLVSADLHLQRRKPSATAVFDYNFIRTLSLYIKNALTHSIKN